MDAEILMDTSGSMEGSSLANAKKAASQFVDFMNTGDKVGVSSFDSGARVNYGLTEIGKEEPSAAQTGAKAAIDGLRASGSTAMGYGLQIAQGQLNSLGKDEGGHIDPAKSIILLSDGQENMSPYVSAVLPGIIKDDIRVCTIGLGAGSDKALLKKIAQDTGCTYKYISDPGALKDVFCEVWTELSGQQIVEKNKNLVFPSATVTGNFFIDSGLQKATFYLGWEGSDMDLKLIAPDGTVLERATAGPDMKFAEGETYELFEIQGPMTGEWRYEIYGKDVPAGGEEATLFVSGESGLSFNVGFDKSEYSQGDRIVVTASVEDAVLDIAEAQYVKGASFGAEVLLPDNHVATLILSDDGAHGDGIADDGIYGGYFENTNLEGNYNFTIRAAGNTNREGDPFTREKTMTLIVNRRLKPVAEANGPYVGYVGETLSFSADGSYDSQGRGLRYRWDFDSDGIFDRDFSNEINAEKIFGNAFSGKAILEVSNGVDKATDAADDKVYGAKTLKEEAVSGLKSVSNPGVFGNSVIGNAVLFISQSLSAGLWRDDSRLKTEMLAGAAVFDKEEAAALQLQILKGRDIKWAAVADAALVKLAKADEILVRVALEEQGEAAAGIENAYQKDMAGKILLEAQRHFVAARDMAAAGRYPEAIARFKTAWVLAVQIESLSSNVFASSSPSLDLSRYPYPTTFSSSQGLPCCQSA